MSAVAEKKEVIKGGAFLIEERTPQEIFTPEDFTEEHRMIAETTRQFMDAEVLPRINELENKDWKLARELVKQAADLGLDASGLGLANAAEETKGWIFSSCLLQVPPIASVPSPQSLSPAMSSSSLTMLRRSRLSLMSMKTLDQGQTVGGGEKVGDLIRRAGLSPAGLSVRLHRVMAQRRGPRVPPSKLIRLFQRVSSCCQPADARRSFGHPDRPTKAPACP